MRRYQLPLLLLLAGLLPALCLARAASDKPVNETRVESASSASSADSDKSIKEAALRGRAVCVDESGRRIRDSDCPATHRLFAIEAADGGFYGVSPADSMAEVFIDPRVRARELLLTARLHRDNSLEIIKVQSIREGKLYDIYYYCEVCNITRNALQLCPCCRDEMAFVETAAHEGEP